MGRRQALQSPQRIIIYLVIIVIVLFHYNFFSAKLKDCNLGYSFDNGTLISKDFINEAVSQRLSAIAKSSGHEMQLKKGAQSDNLKPKKCSHILKEEEKQTSPTIFQESSYQEAVKEFPIVQSRCKLILDMSLQYYVCAHDPNSDKAVSDSVMKRQAWEKSIAEIIVRALREIGSAAIFLDIGSNIGSHSLYAAACGFQVWAVEALSMNHVKLYHAANMSNVSKLIHQVHNIMDIKRRSASIVVARDNIGGSSVQLDNRNPRGMYGSETVEAILLSDVIDAIAAHENSTKQTKLVLKMDIEHFECRALLGSPKLFQDPRTFIPYIIMEWTFVDSVLATGQVLYTKECPEAMIKEMTSMLVAGGYKPYQEITGFPLNPDISHTWSNANVGSDLCYTNKK